MPAKQYVYLDVEQSVTAPAFSPAELLEIFPRDVKPTRYISSTLFTGALILAVFDSILIFIGVIAMAVR